MIKLSPSAIKEFKNCPRCFWLGRVKNIKQPRGIFPSLPGGMDRIIKPWFDKHRAQGLVPKELCRDGKLYPDQGNLDKWRNWRTGMEAQLQMGSETVKVSGALDDLFINMQGLAEPLDYKTRGAAPKMGDSETYYGTQLDTYALMLQENGFKLSGKGHLVYYWPISEWDNSDDQSLVSFDFKTEVVTLSVDPQRAIDLAFKACECLAKVKEPDPHPNCEYCQWRNELTLKGY